MSNSATDMLVSAAIEFLRAYPPFDRMEYEALRFLGEHALFAYYPRGALILSPDAGVVQQLRIVQRGKVAVRYAGEAVIDDPSSLTLGPGESFSIGAVMAQRASTSSYTALDDVFCYELSAESFFALLQQSAVLRLGFGLEVQCGQIDAHVTFHIVVQALYHVQQLRSFCRPIQPFMILPVVRSPGLIVALGVGLGEQGFRLVEIIS